MSNKLYYKKKNNIDITIKKNLLTNKGRAKLREYVVAAMIDLEMTSASSIRAYLYDVHNIDANIFDVNSFVCGQKHKMKKVEN